MNVSTTSTSIGAARDGSSFLPTLILDNHGRPLFVGWCSSARRDRRTDCQQEGECYAMRCARRMR